MVNWIGERLSIRLAQTLLYRTGLIKKCEVSASHASLNALISLITLSSSMQFFIIHLMDKDNLSLTNKLEELLFNSLNEQGYLFQEICKQMLQNADTKWTVCTDEYPVSFQGQDTKIDIILRHEGSVENYVIIECKRANPDYTCWLFAARQSDFKAHPSIFVLNLNSGELVSSNRRVNPIARIMKMELNVPTDIAHNWLEVKESQKGFVSNPQNIETAFAQVLKGISGFAQEVREQKCKTNYIFTTMFIPVVITTAKLYCADYNSTEIDLSTGTIEKDKVSFGNNKKAEEKPCMLVHYGASSALTPSYIPDTFYDDNPKELIKYKLRSIFIVNSNYIVQFFKNLGLNY
jgi:hypothetical protein